LELRWSHRPNTYHDSIKLLRVSEALAAEPGVVRAAAVMATPLNVDLLADDGLLPAGLALSSDDLLVAVLGEDLAASEAAMARVDDLLRVRRTDEMVEALPARTVEASAALLGASVAVIGVPGPSAAAEAFAALRSGLHVFLFSDNVSVNDEVRLKTLAAELDLLMMGPDCGTAILGGVGLGFANRVERGPVGIVGASGTGIQQVCCLLDAAGVGIAQAIGTGGRDLSAAVGGSMTRRGLKMLEASRDVEIIAVISKPADAETARVLHEEMAALSKPVVACLLGEARRSEGSVRYAKTLTVAARDLVAPARGELSLRRTVTSQFRRPGRVYGFFTGGTLCTEAAQALDEQGVAHHLIDLGADEYTRGRAHPIIDPRLRTSMLSDLRERDDVAVVLLDVVLGDLAHPDPAGALLPGIEALRSGSDAPVVATLVGARRDPQGLQTQTETLVEAGVLIFSSNAEAAHYAGSLVRR
jgi:FdrA protein